MAMKAFGKERGRQVVDTHGGTDQTSIQTDERLEGQIRTSGSDAHMEHGLQVSAMRRPPASEQGAAREEGRCTGKK